MNKIPINIITGFLGVGKTTAILNLLKNKPNNQKWAVIVNEFGKVAIDNKTFEGIDNSGIEIKEVAGGCICCTANMPFKASLANILMKVQPQRIIIEPSGLGLITAMDEVLQSESFEKLIDVRSSICMVDANQINDLRIQNNEIYKKQLETADIVLINKTDVTTTETISNFKWWLAENIGTKQYIGNTINGQIDYDLLNVQPVNKLNAIPTQKPFIHFLGDKQFTLVPSENTVIAEPKSKNPSVIPNNIGNYKAYGLIFVNTDVFDKNKLTNILKNIKVLRLKGIFNTQQGYFLYNRINNFFSHTATSAVSESRLEMITFIDDVVNFDAIKNELVTAILPATI